MSLQGDITNAFTNLASLNIAKSVEGVITGNNLLLYSYLWGHFTRKFVYIQMNMKYLHALPQKNLKNYYDIYYEFGLSKQI